MCKYNPPQKKNLSKCFFPIFFHWSSVHSWLLTKVLKSLQRYAPDSLPPSKHIPAGKEVQRWFASIHMLASHPCNPRTPWKMKVFLFKGPQRNKPSNNLFIQLGWEKKTPKKLTTPPKFNSSLPKHGWLENTIFHFGKRPIFRGISVKLQYRVFSDLLLDKSASKLCLQPVDCTRIFAPQGERQHTCRQETDSRAAGGKGHPQQGKVLFQPGN